MPAAHHARNQSGLGRGIAEEMWNAIVAQVVQRLGEPSNLLAIHVHKLWTDRYRANVLVGASLASATIRQSFFLVTDGAGNITASTPPIVQLV